MLFISSYIDNALMVNKDKAQHRTKYKRTSHNNIFRKGSNGKSMSSFSLKPQWRILNSNVKFILKINSRKTTYYRTNYCLHLWTVARYLLLPRLFPCSDGVCVFRQPLKASYKNFTSGCPSHSTLNHCYFFSKGNFRLVCSLLKVPQPDLVPQPLPANWNILKRSCTT
jgi:hypothetical protein